MLSLLGNEIITRVKYRWIFLLVLSVPSVAEFMNEM